MTEEEAGMPVVAQEEAGMHSAGMDELEHRRLRAGRNKALTKHGRRGARHVVRSRAVPRQRGARGVVCTSARLQHARVDDHEGGGGVCRRPQHAHADDVTRSEAQEGVLATPAMSEG
jgi:hypothetical protein